MGHLRNWTAKDESSQEAHLCTPKQGSKERKIGYPNRYTEIRWYTHDINWSRAGKDDRVTMKD